MIGEIGPSILVSVDGAKLKSNKEAVVDSSWSCTVEDEREKQISINKGQ